MRHRLLLGLLATALTTPAWAGEGTTRYATTNCYVFNTGQGATLFERSGGGEAKLEQRVSGVLDDFGYQELKDALTGEDLMVGWVQNHGVTDEVEIAAFKKNCR